jgi:hypothetical protein
LKLVSTLIEASKHGPSVCAGIAHSLREVIHKAGLKLNRPLEALTANMGTGSPPWSMSSSSSSQNPSTTNPALMSQAPQLGRPKSTSTKPRERMKSQTEVVSDICKKKRKFRCPNKDCVKEYSSASALGFHKKKCKTGVAYEKEALD